MSVEFDTPANRIIQQFEPKNKFRIDTSLPDIAFLRQLSIQGRMRYFTGVITAGSQTPISIIPVNGETLFIGGGSWSGGSSNAINITVSNDAQVREIVFISAANISNGSFQFKLDSLVGDGIKEFKVDATVTSSSRFSIWGWIENTSRIRDVTT